MLIASEHLANGLKFFSVTNMKQQTFLLATFILFCLWCQTLLAEKNILTTYLERPKNSLRHDWDMDGTLPEFCSRLISNPVPFNKTCKRDFRTMRRQYTNEFQMFSQFQQDFFLYTRHFRKLKRRGVYLDIASNHPISISNTYFFDRCLNWRGICAEANSLYFEPLYSERSCGLVPTCVGSKSGELVKFVLNGGAGGILGDTYKSQNKVDLASLDVALKKCTTVHDILRREGLKVVDYFSLDVEGHELEILKGIDFNKVKIHVMTVELNGKDRGQIESFLKSKGYRQLKIPKQAGLDIVGGLLREDAIFLHKSTVFGNP